MLPPLAASGITAIALDYHRTQFGIQFTQTYRKPPIGETIPLILHV
jgi:hypothetical protein